MLISRGVGLLRTFFGTAGHVKVGGERIGGLRSDETPGGSCGGLS